MKTKIFILLLSIISLSSCEKIFFEEDISNTPINNFEMFWSDFDKFYPSFEIKQIDWDSVYRINRPGISDQTSDIQLYNVLSSMIKPLKDGHVTLVSNLGQCDSDTIPHDYYSNMRIHPQSYLSSFEINNSNISNWSVKNYNIGYISINTFDVKGEAFVYADDSFLIIDDIIKQFKDKDGIIIDLRWNGGGFPTNVETIVNRFTDSKRLYIKLRSKNGPRKNDFSDWIDCYIEPKGPEQFLKPVVVLTSKSTGSAAEWFTLAMKTLPNTTIVGDTTAGCFSPKIERELPNGWSFTLSSKIAVSADMVQYEGFGIPPDYSVLNTKSDFTNKRDAILEKGIEVIEMKKRQK
ncbi:MAG: S41 family peptidase [Bacteroidales bacterium]|nr:S41 family peptidase [Bacteroidales bacterium]